MAEVVVYISQHFAQVLGVFVREKKFLSIGRTILLSTELVLHLSGNSWHCEVLHAISVMKRFSSC